MNDDTPKTKAICKGVCVRERSVQRSRQKVWRVEQVELAIMVKEPLIARGYKFYMVTPPRIEIANKEGDHVVEVARLGKASDVHSQGAVRSKNTGGEWVPFHELEIVQKDDEGWIA